MHDVLIVGIPLIAILAGILFNNTNATGLRSEMKDVRSEMKDVRSEMKDVRSEMKDFRSEMKADMRELRSEMRTRFDLVDSELRYFHGTVGKLDARMDAIEKRS
jgi:predicted  nucleic acid-binding Zn-ribbon protein